MSDGMKYYDPLASVEMMQTLEGVSSGELAVRAAALGRTWHHLCHER